MVEQLCEVLENPTEDNGDQQLLKLLDECGRGNHEIVCVSRMVIVCAGHSESHYWTNSTTRQLANGNLRFHSHGHGHLYLSGLWISCPPQWSWFSSCSPQLHVYVCGCN